MADRKGSITVPLGVELLARVNAVARAHNKKACQFVKELLEEKTSHCKDAVEAIAKLEREIVERERPQ
jgi:hypothetical protein